MSDNDLYFTQDVINKLRSIFITFDKDKDGSLSTSEFKTFVNHLGEHLTKAEITCAMQLLDNDNNGKISFNEFLLWFEES